MYYFPWHDCNKCETVSENNEVLRIVCVVEESEKAVLQSINGWNYNSKLWFLFLGICVLSTYLYFYKASTSENIYVELIQPEEIWNIISYFLQLLTLYFHIFYKHQLQIGYILQTWEAGFNDVDHTSSPRRLKVLKNP